MHDLRADSRCRVLIIVFSIRLLNLVLFLSCFVDFFVDLGDTLALDGLNIFTAAVKAGILGEPLGHRDWFLIE